MGKRLSCETPSCVYRCGVVWKTSIQTWWGKILIRKSSSKRYGKLRFCINGWVTLWVVNWFHCSSRRAGKTRKYRGWRKQCILFMQRLTKSLVLFVPLYREHFLIFKSGRRSKVCWSKRLHSQINLIRTPIRLVATIRLLTHVVKALGWEDRKLSLQTAMLAKTRFKMTSTTR